MTGGAGAFTAMRVAERLRNRVAEPWEVFGERILRYELHLNGARIEMRRAPVALEGYGLRFFRPVDESLAVGTAAGTDLSDAGVDAQVARAEATTAYSRFPARKVELPGPSGAGPSVEVVDHQLWDHPVESLERLSAALLRPLEGRTDVVPSFGSVRVSLFESTLANSEGLQRRHAHTVLELEFAVKAMGGPEGAAPGEYWSNQRHRTLPEERGVEEMIRRWARLAEDMRHAKTPSSAATRVVLPPAVLGDILPAIVGFRLSGPAQLRKMMPPLETRVGAEALTVHDHGLLPYAVGSAPFDDEGVPQARRSLIERGVLKGSLQDLLHASALSAPGGGNGRRDSQLFPSWFHFAQGVTAGPTTLEVAPGSGGSDEELMEALGEGIWVDQLGYAFPDPVSGSFGGELRAAYRVRGGKRAEALRGGTLGGVVFAAQGTDSLLHQVAAIGSRTELVGALQTPPWIVAGMTVAGS